MNKESQLEICPVYDTLDLFNRKWVIAIIMDLFLGYKHFYDFKNHNPSLSNQVLSKTLKFMEQNNLIEKTVFEDKRDSTEYYLTEKGRKLNKILIEMLNYSLEELESSKLDDETKNNLKEKYGQILLQ